MQKVSNKTIGRPRKGEYRKCFGCKNEIYVRAYRTNGFFCRKCASQLNSVRKPNHKFMAELIKRMAQCTHQIKNLNIESCKIDEQIKNNQHILNSYNIVLEICKK